MRISVRMRSRSCFPMKFCLNYKGYWHFYFRSFRRSGGKIYTRIRSEIELWGPVVLFYLIFKVLSLIVFESFECWSRPYFFSIISRLPCLAWRQWHGAWRIRTQNWQTLLLLLIWRYLVKKFNFCMQHTSHFSPLIWPNLKIKS